MNVSHVSTWTFPEGIHCSRSPLLLCHLRLPLVFPTSKIASQISLFLIIITVTMLLRLPLYFTQMTAMPTESHWFAAYCIWSRIQTQPCPQLLCSPSRGSSVFVVFQLHGLPSGFSIESSSFLPQDFYAVCCTLNVLSLPHTFHWLWIIY